MIKISEILTKTQADGAQTVSIGNFDNAKLHQIQVSTSATPAAGTLTVAIKTPGSDSFATLPWTIDLTALATTAVFQFTGFANQIRFTPTSFDADKTYTVIICTGERSVY
jgi:hypothetical protein